MVQREVVQEMVEDVIVEVTHVLCKSGLGIYCLACAVQGCLPFFKCVRELVFRRKYAPLWPYLKGGLDKKLHLVSPCWG